MREILFRGKRVDNGEWIFGSLILDERGNHYIGEYIRQRVESAYVCTKRGNGKTINRFIGIGFFMVLPETVGQYMGLTDKNGKKVFEGDIVKNDYRKGQYQYFKIVYDTRVYCGQVENKYGMLGFLYNVIGDLEVIGNIHDNKELLEVK